MWRKIAAQDPSFGHPDKFCYDPEQTNWMSATVETPVSYTHLTLPTNSRV